MKHSTSTQLFTRLFVEREGHGRMMASVPLHLGELAQRVVAEDIDLFGSRYRSDRMKVTGKRIVFRLDPDLWPVQEDLRAIKLADLGRDRDTVAEVLNRVAVSGWTVRAVLVEELAYLQSVLPSGYWESGLVVVGQD